jgi:hypothetical protein
MDDSPKKIVVHLFALKSNRNKFNFLDIGQDWEDRFCKIFNYIRQT